MNINIKDLPAQALIKLQPFKRYSIVVFVVFLVAIYGYLVLQINSANSVAPAVTEQVVTAHASPKIDEDVVKQLQQLQDNSVTVKTLFNQARTNPFE